MLLADMHPCPSASECVHIFSESTDLVTKEVAADDSGGPLITSVDAALTGHGPSFIHDRLVTGESSAGNRERAQHPQRSRERVGERASAAIGRSIARAGGRVVFRATELASEPNLVRRKERVEGGHTCLDVASALTKPIKILLEILTGSQRGGHSVAYHFAL